MRLPSDEDQCAVLISSCGSYADLWTPHLVLFERYWSDCPWPIFLGTDCSKPAPCSTLRAPPGAPWSHCLRRYLSQLKSEYVVFLLDDFFFQDIIITSRVLEALAFAERNHATCVRLVARPAPRSRNSQGERFSEILPGEPYRVSTQGAIWRRSRLQTLLMDSESAWEFEIEGTRRLAAVDRVFGVHSDILTYKHHVVERGMWFPWSARKFARMGIGCDLQARRVMPPHMAAKWLIRKAFDITRTRIRKISSFSSSRPVRF